MGWAQREIAMWVQLEIAMWAQREIAMWVQLEIVEWLQLEVATWARNARTPSDSKPKIVSIPLEALEFPPTPRDR